MAERKLLSSWSQMSSSAYENNQERYNYPRMSELVEVLDRSTYENQYQSIRLLGPIVSLHTHVVECKKKDGSKYCFYIPCCNFDPATQSIVENDCPYCKIGCHRMVRFYENAIVRSIEGEHDLNSRLDWTEEESKLKKFSDFAAFFKDKKSRSWTPVRVVEIPASVSRKLQNLEGLNYHKDENGERVTASIADLEYGIDILITYRPGSKEPANMYDVQRDPESLRSPISKEIRKNLLLWNIFQLPEVDTDKIKEDFKRSCLRINPEKVKHPEVLEEYIKANTQEFKKNNAEPSNKPAIKSVSLPKSEMPKENDIMEEAESEVKSMEFEDIKDSSNESAPWEEDDFEDLD